MAALAELAGWRETGDVGARVDELAGYTEPVAAAALAAREGRLEPADVETVRPRCHDSRPRSAPARSTPPSSASTASSSVDHVAARASRRRRRRRASAPSSRSPACRPRSSVSSGSPATGQTSSDEPTASISPAFMASTEAVSIARSGSISPNRTTSGLSTAPQSQRGTLAPRARLGQRVRRAAVQARGRPDRPVDLDRLRARRGVQPVDVLGDHAGDEPAPLQLGDRAVRAVGLLAVEDREALAVEGPEALGVAAPDGDVRDLHRVDVRPQPGHRRAEVGDPGRHRDPRPRQDDHRPRVGDQLREALGAHWPLNSGARFAMKAAMPSRASSEANACRNASRSAASPSSRSRGVRDALDLLDRDRRLAGQLAPPGQREVEQLVVLDDAVDEPVLEGLLGRDRVADGVHLQRLGRPDEPREPLGAAEAGDDPEVDLGLAEGRRARRRGGRRRPSRSRSRRRTRGR